MTLASDVRIYNERFPSAVDVRAHNEAEALLDAYRAADYANGPHPYRDSVVSVPGVASRMHTCYICGYSGYALRHRQPGLANAAANILSPFGST